MSARPVADRGLYLPPIPALSDPPMIVLCTAPARRGDLSASPLILGDNTGVCLGHAPSIPWTLCGLNGWPRALQYPAFAWSQTTARPQPRRRRLSRSLRRRALQDLLSLRRRDARPTAAIVARLLSERQTRLPLAGCAAGRAVR